MQLLFGLPRCGRVKTDASGASPLEKNFDAKVTKFDEKTIKFSLCLALARSDTEHTCLSYVPAFTQAFAAGVLFFIQWCLTSCKFKKYRIHPDKPGLVTGQMCQEMCSPAFLFRPERHGLQRPGLFGEEGVPHQHQIWKSWGALWWQHGRGQHRLLLCKAEVFRPWSSPMVDTLKSDILIGFRVSPPTSPVDVSTLYHLFLRRY